MRLGIGLLVLTLGLLMAGCGGGGQPAADTGDPAALGEQTFSQWCAPCHGAGGEGFVNALDAPALNADGESYLLTDEAILAAIIDGGAAGGGPETNAAMAPLGDQLTAEQESAVLHYVHTLWTDGQQAAHEKAGGHIAP